MLNHLNLAINFDKDISFKLDHGDTTDEVRGDLLSITFLILRILSITKDSPGRSFTVDALQSGNELMEDYLNQILSEYVDEYKLDEASLSYESDLSVNKGFTLSLSYENDNHKNKFKTIGFGLLGKAVGFHSLILIFVTYKYLSDKYQQDKTTMKKISFSTVLCAKTISNKGKLNSLDEYRAIEEIVYVSQSIF